MSTFAADNQTDFTNLYSSGSIDDLANILASDAFRGQTHIRIFLDGFRSQTSPLPIITHDHLVLLHIEARVDPTPALTSFSIAHLHTIQVVIKSAAPNEEAIEAALEALFDKTPTLIKVGAEYCSSSILSRKLCQKIIQREIAMAQ